MSLGKASPYRTGMCSWVLSLAILACRQSVGRSHRGDGAGVAPSQPRSQVRPAPPPVAAFASRVALWEGFPL